MRYLKLYESFEDIDSICKKYGIKNYTVNGDGSIDVDGNVDLHYKGLTEIPLKFRDVSKTFHCASNELTSLKGSPESISYEFNCYNNKLTSLEGGPKSIVDDYTCSVNKIRTLEWFPRNLGGDFYCYYNPIYQLWRLFEDKDKVELFNDYGITDGEFVILDRLNEFLEMIEKPIIGCSEHPLNDTIHKIQMEGYKII